jgi:hypothetical protein
MKHLYLTVLSPNAVACQVEGIALCLGPSTVALTLPLNAAECQKLSFAAMAGDQVVFQDGIQLPCSQLEAALGGYAQLSPWLSGRWWVEGLITFCVSRWWAGGPTVAS